MRLQILFIFMVVKHPSILDFRYPTVTRSYPFPTRFQLVLARYVKFGTTKAAQAVTILLVIRESKLILWISQDIPENICWLVVWNMFCFPIYWEQ